VRVYLPATLPLLERWQTARSCGTGPVLGHAVTASLREWFVVDDLEELEAAATTAAARASLALLATAPHAPPRRVVVAADARDADVTAVPGDPRGTVRCGGALPWSAVVAVLIDDPAAGPDVAAAVAALPAADAGDADAAFSVDGAAGHELAWFAAQEVAELLGREC